MVYVSEIINQTNHVRIIGIRKTRWIEEQIQASTGH